MIRSIGQGRWEHPLHEHGNHVRILAARTGTGSQRSDRPTSRLFTVCLFT